MSIMDNLTALVADEGKKLALDRCMELQSALETIMEIGDHEEQKHANVLLVTVNEAIMTILDRRIIKHILEPKPRVEWDISRK